MWNKLSQNYLKTLIYNKLHSPSPYCYNIPTLQLCHIYFLTNMSRHKMQLEKNKSKYTNTKGRPDITNRGHNEIKNSCRMWRGRKLHTTYCISVYASLFYTNLVHVQPTKYSLRVNSRTISVAPMAANDKGNYFDPSHSPSTYLISSYVVVFNVVRMCAILILRYRWGRLFLRRR